LWNEEKRENVECYCGVRKEPNNKHTKRKSDIGNEKTVCNEEKELSCLQTENVQIRTLTNTRETRITKE
jgi:hypothetical protein